ncbi:MAG: glutamate racemase [Deltaproteobacteria bacterium]|nr:glutamate racemase [Deltaproteobacteria bacterium]
MDCSRPIGVFDSGLGGLTVARELNAALPWERIVYLGDTARVPYGTRSAGTVIRYARGCARFLAKSEIKALVVACNTVSAVAMDHLRAELDLPVLGVIGPGARAAVCASRTGRIGVLATLGTVASGAYPREVAGISSRCEVFQRAAPLLVSLAEEGWLDGEVPRLAARRYLEPLVASGVDVVLLGCTHFPLLRACIEEVLAELAGGTVRVVDSAQATAQHVAVFLAERGLAAAESQGGLHVCVTDLPGTFEATAAAFLGAKPDSFEEVDL